MNKRQAIRLREQKAVEFLTDMNIISALQDAIEKLESSVYIDMSVYTEEEKKKIMVACKILKYDITVTYEEDNNTIDEIMISL